MSVVAVKELEKTFVKGFWRKRHVALRGASFVVEPGEIFGFLGPNGAGKTTTLKILMGLIKADGGEALMFGKPSGDPATRRRVGYLPESPYFYDHLTANELLDMMGALYGIDGVTRRARARTLLERVGIAHAAKRPLRSYSKGMLQRVGLGGLGALGFREGVLFGPPRVDLGLLRPDGLGLCFLTCRLCFFPTEEQLHHESDGEDHHQV